VLAGLRLEAKAMQFSSRILGYPGKSNRPAFLLLVFEPSHSAVEAINPHFSALPADKLKEVFAQ
jgi:hypothetical protein